MKKLEGGDGDPADGRVQVVGAGPLGKPEKWGWLGPDPTAGIKGGWRDWAAGLGRGGWGEQGGRGGM